MAIFAFPSRMAWAILAVFGVAAYGALLMMGVAIRIESLLLPLTAISSCLAISAFYTHVRPDRRLAVMAAGTAFILTFGATAGPLTYPAASIGLPLRDDLFIAFERSIGIDWPSLADALTPMPTANLLWAIIYMSSLPQIAVAVLALGFTDRHERLASYLWLLVTSIVCTIVLFVLAPAAGPVSSFAIDADLYARIGSGGKSFLADFQALRQGRLEVFDLAKLEGIISFPSFHTVLAILTAWALAPLRWVGGLAIGLNGLVILSTVPQGGHYLADIIAGSLIAFACIAAGMSARIAAVPRGLPSMAG